MIDFIDDFIDYAKESFGFWIWVAIATVLTVVIVIIGRCALYMYLQSQGFEPTRFCVEASGNPDNAQTYYAPTLDTLEINEVSINETVLVDKNGIKIKAVGAEFDEESNIRVHLEVENNTDKSVTLYASGGTVNNRDILPMLYGGHLVVGANEKAETILGYLRYDLQIHGLSTVDTLGVTFRISDTDGNFLENCWYTEPVVMKANESILTYGIKPTVVYNTNGVKVSIIGIYNNEDTGDSDVVLYIENYNTFGVSIESSNIGANGYVTDVEFNKYIKPESVELRFIEFKKADGFDGIDYIKLALDIIKVYDTGYEPIGNTGEILVKFLECSPKADVKLANNTDISR